MAKIKRRLLYPSNAKLAIISFTFLLLLIIPVTVLLLNRPTNFREHAAGNTPTIKVTLVDTLVSGPGYEAYGTFGSHNQKVVSNSHGIFITYLHSDYTAGGSDNSVWRLARSTDGGQSFQTIYQESSPNSKAPTLETDENDNLYLISEAGGGSWGSSPSIFHRFDASANYQNPLITRPVPVSAGKFASVYDPQRKVIYSMTWNNNGRPDFFVISLNGTLLKQVQLWSSSTTVEAHYPQLHLAPDGTLFAAWTNTDLTAPGQDYYDVHFIASPDGGNTWIGPSGTLNLPFSSYTGSSSWEIVDSADIKPIGTTQDNWLDNLAFNGGHVHFVYDVGFGRKEVYKRFNWTTKQFDREETPYIHGETITIGQTHGFFTQAGTGSGRLFYVGGANGSLYGKIGALYSDDNGSSWHDFAYSSAFQADSSHQIWFLGGAHKLMADGSIIGTFTLHANNSAPSYVYFFRSVGGNTTVPTSTSAPGGTSMPTVIPTTIPTAIPTLPAVSITASPYATLTWNCLVPQGCNTNLPTLFGASPPLSVPSPTSIQTFPSQYIQPTDQFISWSGKTRPVPGGRMKATLPRLLPLGHITGFRANKKNTYL